MEIKRKQPLGIELVRRGVVNGDAIEKHFNTKLSIQIED